MFDSFKPARAEAIIFPSVLTQVSYIDVVTGFLRRALTTRYRNAWPSAILATDLTLASVLLVTKSTPTNS